MGLTPTVRKKYDREAALADAARGLGGQLDVTPEDALTAAVQMSAADAAYWRDVAAGLGPSASTSEAATVYQLAAAAVDRMARNAKMAADVGVTERQNTAARRVGHAVADALDAAMRKALGGRLTEADRRELIGAFGAELHRLESGTVEGRAAT